MEPLLVFPDPPPPVLSQGLDLGGYPWTGVGSEADVERLEPEEGWPGAVVVGVTDPDGAFALCRAIRKGDIPLEPLLLVVSEDHGQRLQVLTPKGVPLQVLTLGKPLTGLCAGEQRVWVAAPDEHAVHSLKIL